MKAFVILFYHFDTQVINEYLLFISQSTRKSFLFWRVSGSLLVYTFGKNLLQQTEPHPYFGDHRQVWCTAGLRQCIFEEFLQFQA